MRALVLITLVACSSSKSPNELPAETWATADYVKAGVPALDHRWTVAEHDAAVSALERETQGHRERLPHKGGAKSGELFARIIDQPANDTSVLGDQEAFVGHAQRYDALNRLSKLYTVNQMAGASVEYLAIMGVMLREAQILQSRAEPFLATFPADDPSLPARRTGLAQMRSGYGTMLLGGLMLCADIRIAEPARVSLARDIRSVWGTLYPATEPGTQAMLEDQLGQMQKLLTDGPLKQALPPAP